MKDRIQCLLKEMAKGIYEKDTELAMSLLAAIAGESLILLGPPGVAKSMVARRVKAAFREGRSWIQTSMNEALMDTCQWQMWYSWMKSGKQDLPSKIPC